MTKFNKTTFFLLTVSTPASPHRLHLISFLLLPPLLFLLLSSSPSPHLLHLLISFLLLLLLPPLFLFLDHLYHQRHAISCAKPSQMRCQFTCDAISYAMPFHVRYHFTYDAISYVNSQQKKVVLFNMVTNC